MVDVEVIIPAKNEEKNIAGAVASVDWARQVWVVDSRSSDRTAQIAAFGGATVVQFDYPGRGPKKKNWALENLPLASEWVLIVDADERVPDALREEILRATARGGAAGYYVDREYHFLGRDLKAFRPNWNLRLFRRGFGRYEALGTDVPGTGDNEIHEQVVVNGPIGYLREPLLHLDTNPLARWVENHNRYSEWEAHVYRKYLAEAPDLVAVLGRDPARRKRALKRIWVRLPLRPLIRFLYFYVRRGAFREGKPGFIYSVLMGFYEFVIGAKLYELEVREREAQSREESGAE